MDTVCAVLGPSADVGPSAPLGIEEVVVDAQEVELQWARIVGPQRQEQLQPAALDVVWLPDLEQLGPVLLLASAPLAPPVGIVQQLLMWAARALPENKEEGELELPPTVSGSPVDSAAFATVAGGEGSSFEQRAEGSLVLILPVGIVMGRGLICEPGVAWRTCVLRMARSQVFF